MNLEFLRSKINDKFGTIENFADQLGLTRASVSRWLNERAEPEEDRIFDIINLLELSEDESDKLLDVAPTQVSFRRNDMSASEIVTYERAKGIADTFFKINGSQYGVKEFLSIATEQKLSVDLISDFIRTNLLDLKSDEPASLQNVVAQLKKHSINIFFVPFQKLGLTEQHHSREVAFFVRKGSRAIIFADTERTLDQSLFDICHELAHLVINQPSSHDSKVEELCNCVAEALIYPRDFFTKNAVPCTQLLSNLDANSFNDYYELVYDLYQKFDWCPKGLSIALKNYGYIKEGSIEEIFLLEFNNQYKEETRTIDQDYFAELNLNNLDSLIEFYEKHVNRKKDFYKPFVEIKNAAIFGRLSARRLSEVLCIDSGDADEIIKIWTKEEKKNLKNLASITNVHK